ncbi:hypothetical protein Q9L58_007420 [Maublancomyces gigas]|uniref:Uncharacterized protein n=1 Tax=Discina gigas TaxID=1032678 RepID=A0ABR3GCJ8_9PEZI
MPSPPSLQVLSTELLHRIGDCLDDQDLAHLARVNRLFRLVFAPPLVKRSWEDKPSIIMIPALIWAIRHSHKVLVEQIILDPNFRPDKQDILGALHEAAAMGYRRIISMLVEVGYPVNRIWGPNSDTPLHVSAISGYSATSKILLNHGATINLKNGDGKTPPRTQVDRICAYQETDLRVVSTLRTLIDHGAHLEIMAMDNTGYNPLHQAVLACVDSDRDHCPGAGSGAIRLLVEHGANPHARAEAEWTPIQLSVGQMGGSKTAISCFLNLGISPNHVGPNGFSLLSKAMGFDKKAFEITELLLNRGAIPDNTFRLCDIFYELHGNPDEALFEKLLILLLLHGAEFRGSEAKCFTYAAYHGMLSVMQAIGQHHPGVNMNKAVRFIGKHHHRTPLQIAIKSRNLAMLEFLINQEVKMTEDEVVLVDAILVDELLS